MRARYLFIFLLLSACTPFWPNGHGSIKGYRYPVTKWKLEKAVLDVIKNDSNIFRDTAKQYITVINQDDSNKKKVITNNYYNDGTYITIKIKSGAEVNEYIFRYYGDKDYWDTASSSEIFICYAYDKNDNGGAGRDNLIDDLKNKLTGVFEAEFVSKIDKELNVKRREINN